MVIQNNPSYTYNREPAQKFRAVYINLVSLLFLFGLVGCNGSTSILPITPSTTSTAMFPAITPTNTSIITNTPKPSTTIMPIKTSAPIVMITPYPTLSPSGPHLAYLKDNNLFILDVDGRGRKVIKLPENGYVGDLKTAISPDGRWLVFHLGDATWLSTFDIPRELSINLIYILDGSIHPIARLFPESISNLLNWGDYGDILAYNWSSDGRYLAFAGAMHSELPELYVYNVETSVIERLTNDSINIWRIEWSPDDKWIWFESAKQVPCCQETSFYVTKFDEEIVSPPTFVYSDTWTSGGGWISSNLYFLYARSDGGDCPLHGFQFINVETGEYTDLWKGSAVSFALDEDEKQLIVSDDCGKPGTFLVDWNGRDQLISDTPAVFKFWGGKAFRFLAYDGKQAWGIDQNGSMIHLSDKFFTDISYSPDNHWFVLYQSLYYSASDVVGMDLLSDDNQFYRTITEQYGYPVAWKSDSTGLFFYSNGLYYLAIPDGQPVLIDDCKPNGCRDLFVWLP